MLVLPDRLYIFFGVVRFPCRSLYPTILYLVYYLSLGCVVTVSPKEQFLQTYWIHRICRVLRISFCSEGGPSDTYANIGLDKSYYIVMKSSLVTVCSFAKHLIKKTILENISFAKYESLRHYGKTNYQHVDRQIDKPNMST